MVIKLKIFSYYAKLLAFLFVFTTLCLILHFFVCLDINTLKINIHNITKNYIILELTYPIFYILLAISIYIYSTTLDSSKNILIIITIYLLILLLLILSSILLFRFANFIFAFWLCILCVFLDSILSLFYLKTYICNFHISILVYLSIALFYFYSFKI
jgi:hypothetical protein